MTTSALPAPGLANATAAVVRLSALRTLRGRKLRVAAVASVIILSFPAVVALFQHDADAQEVVTGGIDWGFYRILVFLLPVLFTSGTIGEEVEGRTLHFLTMRPSSRIAIAFGKFLVGAASTIGVLWTAALLLHVIGYAANPTLLINQLDETARAIGAASLLAVNYCAICLMWGTLLPNAGGMVSLLWLGFIEWFAMLLPGVMRFVSMAHFARELGGIERAGTPTIGVPGGPELISMPDVELWICALVIAVELVLALSIALLTFRFSELRHGKA